MDPQLLTYDYCMFCMILLREIVRIAARHKPAQCWWLAGRALLEKREARPGGKSCARSGYDAAGPEHEPANSTSVL